MIEFDVDMGYLLECDELDKVVLNDEDGEYEPMEFILKDAATVGRGNLTAEQVREAIEQHSAWVIGNNRCFHNGAYEEIADELNATVGAGTCHMRLAYEEEDADGCIWPDHYECDACGAKVNGIMPFYDTEITPRFCPNCGKKVVSE